MVKYRHPGVVRARFPGAPFQQPKKADKVPTERHHCLTDILVELLRLAIAKQIHLRFSRSIRCGFIHLTTTNTTDVYIHIHTRSDRHYCSFATTYYQTITSPLPTSSDFRYRLHYCKTIAKMMNQRELEARIKALHKATQAQEPAASIISLMDWLKKEDVPTEEMLRVSCPICVPLLLLPLLRNPPYICVCPRHDCLSFTNACSILQPFKPIPT